MANSEAFGLDEIDSVALKPVAEEISGPLLHLINTSLISKRFAQKWKVAKVTPRLKSSELNKLEVSSYRPVAILSTVSKLVERNAQQQLLSYLEETKQMNNSNHAYRSALSTTTTLAEILDEIFQGAEERKKTSILLVDQSSAFDTVEHRILLRKLKAYNVGEDALEWIENYLSNRSQFVAIGGGVSRMTQVTTGVPQGSVIGPLLYAVFTNETTEVVKNKDCREASHLDRRNLFSNQCSTCGILSTYADDTTYTVSGNQREENQEKITQTLEKLRKHLNDNKLAINMGKTKTTECMVKQMRGRTRGEPPSLMVEKNPGEWKRIVNSDSSRILGANVQGNLMWSSHLERGEKALFPQVRRHIGMLRSRGKMIPETSRNNIAKGLLLSKMNYLMPLWGGGNK